MKGNKFMKQNKKYCLLIITVVIIGLSFHIKNKIDESYVRLPESYDINNITIITVVNDRGVKKYSIYKEKDINNFLNILQNSKRIAKDSTSNFPNKNKFTIIAFKMSDGGSIINSIYEENGHLYFEQPYYGVFELTSEYKNLKTLINKTVEKDSKEDMSIDIDHILKDDF